MGAEATRIFKERIWWFLVEGIGGKKISLNFDGMEEPYILKTLSGDNGHFNDSVILPKEQLDIVNHRLHFTFGDLWNREFHGR
jgi:hypothetical protein